MKKQKDFCTPADIFAENAMKEVQDGSYRESLKPAVVNLIKEVQKQDKFRPYGQKVIRRGAIPKTFDRLTVTTSICHLDHKERSFSKFLEELNTKSRYLTSVRYDKKPKGGKK